MASRRPKKVTGRVCSKQRRNHSSTKRDKQLNRKRSIAGMRRSACIAKLLNKEA